MTKRTPGKLHWYWGHHNGEADCGVFAEERRGHAMAVMRCPRYQTKEQWEADATFMIRAWENHDALVEALQSLLSATGDGPRHDAAVIKARAALTAAKSE